MNDYAETTTSVFTRLQTASVLLLVLFGPRAGAATPRTAPQSRVVEFRVVEAHDIQFAHLSTADGLSEMAVQQISQDDLGFMWFGTLDGLNRYDGYEFRVRKRGAPGAELGGTTVTALFKDRSGELWIGVDQCLDRFDPITERLTEYRHDPKISTSLGGAVYGITQDRQGEIWLATGTGLDKLDPATGTFTHFRHDDRDPASLAAAGSRNDVRFVGVDGSDMLWVETSAGINSFDLKSGKATRFPQLSNHDEFHVQYVYQDRSGRLWIHSREGNGVGLFDPKTGEFVRYKFITGDPGAPTADRVTCVLEDQQGALWFGAQGSGLLKLDPSRGTVVRYRNDPADLHSLSNNFVLSLYEDREGNIWAGTGGGGINRFPAVPSGFSSYHKKPGEKNSLDQNFVLSVFEDHDGALWLGNDGVLNRIDSTTGGFTFYRHKTGDSSSISDGTVLSTVEDRTGTLWFATYRGGLNSFDRRTGRFKAYRHEPGNPNSPSSDVIMRLQLNAKGSIWVAADHALDEFDPRSKQFKHYPELAAALGASLVTCLSQDQRGMLWLGTNEAGLVRFDPATRRYDVYRNQPGNSAALSSDRVNALLVDAGGTLWIGTQVGLDRFDVDRQQFHAYTEQDGLPSNAVEGILQDRQGNLWVSTGNGLARFTPATKAVRNYYTSDGLAGNEFNYWGAPFQGVHGEMFFPGVDGLTVFHPERIADNRYVPPVLLTDFRLFGTPMSVGSHSPLHESISAARMLTLTHSQSVFSLGFSSLSYAYPERNRYRYMLAGLEEHWNYTDSRRRFATYTTLAPGEYVFRVQGSNNHGVWNEKGISLRIRVLPPWWGTWWFRSVAAAFIVLALWSVHYVRLRTVEGHNRELRDVIDTIPGYVWSARPDGVVDFINRRWLEFSGFSLEQGLGRGWEAAVHPDDLAKYVNEWRAAVASGKAMESEARVRGADGQYRWLLVRNVPLRNERGKIVKWYGTSTDIDDRKRAEEGLRRSNRQLRAIGNCNLSLLHAREEQTLLEDICCIVCEEAGYRIAWVAYAEYDEAKTVRPAAWAGAEEGYLATAGVTWADTERGRGPTGTAIRTGNTCYIQDFATDPRFAPWRESALQRGFRSGIGLPLKEEQGNVFGSLTIHSAQPNAFTTEEIRLLEELAADLAFGVVILRSRAARKQTEQSLRQSEAYLAEAQRLTHTGSWAWDSATGQYAYWSEEMFPIFGFDPQEGLPGKEKVLERIYPEDRDNVNESFERALREKVETFDEYRIAGADGKLKHIQVIRHPVLNGAGDVVRLVGTSIDITERKGAEEERERLRRLEADLAHINRVSMLGELAASIAHEVNQPLAGVVSNGSACLRWLAAEMPNVEEARENARRIVRDGKRAAEVIARIRALSKRAATARETLDLNETIHDVLALVSDEAKKKSVIIRMQFADDLPPISADRVQLQQVVLNLVMNAMEAMSSVSERPRELVITTRNIDAAEVQVTVEDSGTGIDPQKIDKIFDSFYTTKPGGMGMGLSISRSILQAHGGRLWATAKDGAGTIFNFTLPRYHEEELNAGVAGV